MWRRRSCGFSQCVHLPFTTRNQTTTAKTESNLHFIFFWLKTRIGQNRLQVNLNNLSVLVWKWISKRPHSLVSILSSLNSVSVWLVFMCARAHTDDSRWTAGLLSHTQSEQKYVKNSDKDVDKQLDYCEWCLALYWNYPFELIFEFRFTYYEQIQTQMWSKKYRQMNVDAIDWRCEIAIIVYINSIGNFVAAIVKIFVDPLVLSSEVPNGLGHRVPRIMNSN